MQVTSQSHVERAINYPDQEFLCSDFHIGMSCNQKAITQFFITIKSCSKMYFMAHLIPFLIFKRKKFKQNPTKEVLKLMTGFIKSMLFAGGCTFLWRRVICLITKNHKLIGYSNFIAGILLGISLNFEPISRQSQIALFCLNKSSEICYLYARRRNWPVRIAHGECLMMAVAMAIIFFHYMTNKQIILETYRNIMDKMLKDC